MADATIFAMLVDAQGLHIEGSGFTQTTTTVQVDGVDVPFEYVSATELLVSPAPSPGTSVAVTKNGISATADVPNGDTPSAGELPAGGSAGASGEVTGLTTGLPADDYLTEQEKGGTDPVSAPVEPGPVAEPIGVAARQPYPDGAPAVPPAAGVPMNQMPPASEPETPPAEPEVA